MYDFTESTTEYISQLEEQIEKHLKHANDIFKHYRRFKDSDSMVKLFVDCREIAKKADYISSMISCAEIREAYNRNS